MGAACAASRAHSDLVAEERRAGYEALVDEREQAGAGGVPRREVVAAHEGHVHLGEGAQSLRRAMAVGTWARGAQTGGGVNAV